MSDRDFWFPREFDPDGCYGEGSSRAAGYACSGCGKRWCLRHIRRVPAARGREFVDYSYSCPACDAGAKKGRGGD